MSNPEVMPDLRGKLAAKRGRKGAAEQGGRAVGPSTGSGGADDGANGGLGPECPAVALGVNGEDLLFLDDLFQMRVVKPKLDKSMLYSLFGHGWLDERFPMMNAQGDPVPRKFNQDHAQRAVIHACKSKGRVKIDDAQRQRGSHVTRRGALVLHCGDSLVVAGERRPGQQPAQQPAQQAGQQAGEAAAIAPVYARQPGLYERLIFPLDDTIPPPADKAISAWDARECLDHLNKGGWNWQGPATIDLDGEAIDVFAWLLFGWAMSAKLCGALFRRPVLLVKGPSQQGKSTLLARIKDLIGEDWFIAPEDPSEAGVTAEMGKARIAVLLDELEGRDDDPGFIKRMYNLMLRSFDGGGKLRSSADQKAVKTELYSSFQGSCVLPPKMRPQERNRTIIVEIGARIDPSRQYQCPEWFAAVGPKLHRRLAEQWHRYPATLKAYEDEMARRGNTGRERDCYATALACGDLALFGEAPDAALEPGGESRVKAIVDAVVPLIGTVREENVDHPERAINALASSHLPSPGGQVQINVGQWIEKAIVALGSQDTPTWQQARLQLASHGMRLCNLKPDHATSKAGVIELEELATGYLCIAGPTHEGMAKIFKTTEFNQGRWPEALGRVVHSVRDATGAEIGQMPAIKGKIPKIGGWQGSCTLVPLAAICDLDELAEQIAIARDAEVIGQANAEAAAKKRRKERGIEG